MEGGHLSVVPLVVREVEMVGQSLLGPRESHGLQQGLASILKCNDQLELSASFLLFYTDYWKTFHLLQELSGHPRPLAVHLSLGDAELELVPHREDVIRADFQNVSDGRVRARWRLLGD